MEPTPFETVSRKFGEGMDSEELFSVLADAAVEYEKGAALFGRLTSERERWIVAFLGGYRHAARSDTIQSMRREECLSVSSMGHPAVWHYCGECGKVLTGLERRHRHCPGCLEKFRKEKS